MNFVKLNQVFLPVSNLNESKKWYLEHFPLDVPTERIVEQHSMIKLSFEATSFWLVEHAPLNNYTHIPFNFHTNQITEFHNELSSKGIIVTDITADLECFDFYDINGNRIGFCYEANSSNQRHIEVGGTFLAVRNLSEAMEWYSKNLDYQFELFDATGGAGIIGPTLEFMHDITIHYAAVSKKSFKTDWSRITLVETLKQNSLSYKPYNILSSNIHDDYKTLRLRNVKVSKINEENDQLRFNFWDLYGNKIEIVEE